jgi:hypothetical protein
MKGILEAGSWQAKNTSWEEILKASNVINDVEGTADDRIERKPSTGTDYVGL